MRVACVWVWCVCGMFVCIVCNLFVGCGVCVFVCLCVCVWGPWVLYVGVCGVGACVLIVGMV